jgi:uncharacterized protein (TIGR03066 family)
MIVLRGVLVGCLLLAVAQAGLAGEGKAKIDKNKLVGTWTFVKTDDPKPPPSDAVIKVTFTKDGKISILFKVKDMEHKQSGTWSVKGDQLTTVLKGPGDKEEKDTVTIAELTDKKLVTKEKKKGKTITTEFKK